MSIHTASCMCITIQNYTSSPNFTPLLHTSHLNKGCICICQFWDPKWFSVLFANNFGTSKLTRLHFKWVWTSFIRGKICTRCIGTWFYDALGRGNRGEGAPPPSRIGIYSVRFLKNSKISFFLLLGVKIVPPPLMMRIAN